MAQERSPGWIYGLLAGATAMYFLDPRSGRRRRAMLRDKLVHAGNLAEESMERLVQDFGNRTRGAIARTWRRIRGEGPIEDRRLVERVRAVLGRLCSHPHAIQVECHEGVCVLRGPILEDELGEVLTGVRRVPGVREVHSQLNAVRDPRHEPALQGGRPRPGLVPDLFQRNLSPTSRALVGTAGALLAWNGMRRGGFPGMLATAAGGLLMARAATNMEFRRLLGIGTRAGVTVQKTIEVAAPVQEVFAFWSNFRNFPRFMQHLREVTESEGGISHWVADGPAGIPVSWDAEITALEPFKRIAWKSLDGSLIKQAGEVLFEERGPDRTRLTVRMTYNPPGGLFGHAVATLFGADPKHQLDEDLLRFKSLLEEGKATAHGHEVVRQEVEPKLTPPPPQEMPSETPAS